MCWSAARTATFSWCSCWILGRGSLYGHRLLDLNHEYGLDA